MKQNVCPNCGQLYDTELSKCPLCGTAPQVVTADNPAQRKRISELERKQRKADRKEAELEARRRRKSDRMIQDAEEERSLEEEAARRKEEKRRMKEEKRSAKKGGEELLIRRGSSYTPEPVPTPVVTPVPARTSRRPAVQEQAVAADRTRVPRIFLVVSVILLAAAILIGSTYLLWKKDIVKLPVYEKLYARHHDVTEPAATAPGGSEPESSSKNAVVFPDEPTDRPSSQATELPTAPATEAPTGGATEAPAETQTELPTEAPTEVPTETPAETEAPTETVLPTEPPTELPEPTEPLTEDSCRVLTLNTQEMTLDHVGALGQIIATTEPNPTKDRKKFSSSDESVATVSPVGAVTATGAGTAVITVTCGRQTAACTVICDFDDPNATSELPEIDVNELILNKDDMTFFGPGESFPLSITNVPTGTPIVWRSLDETICTVSESGRVIAVGKGTTRVIATYGDLSASCWVRCRFPEEEETEAP